MTDDVGKSVSKLFTGATKLPDSLLVGYQWSLVRQLVSTQVTW
jgi:hypothetical protein